MLKKIHWIPKPFLKCIVIDLLVHSLIYSRKKNRAHFSVTDIVLDPKTRGVANLRKSLGFTELTFYLGRQKFKKHLYILLNVT